MALSTTTSGLTESEIRVAETAIELGAELGRCIASTLPAHHPIAPFFSELFFFHSSRFEGGTVIRSRAEVLALAFEFILPIDAAARVFRPRVILHQQLLDVDSLGQGHCCDRLHHSS